MTPRPSCDCEQPCAPCSLGRCGAHLETAPAQDLKRLHVCVNVNVVSAEAAPAGIGHVRDGRLCALYTGAVYAVYLYLVSEALSSEIRLVNGLCDFICTYLRKV